MKIKTDFITNSSSTAFFFIFKGNKKNLIKALIRNNKKFNFDNCGAENWCHEIPNLENFLEIVRDRKNKTKPIYKLIDTFKSDLEDTKNYRDELKKEKRQDIGGWIKKDLKDQEKRLKLVLNSCVNKNFNKYIELDCGNDGKINSDLAQCVRCNYPRRFISDGLVVVTEERS